MTAQRFTDRDVRENPDLVAEAIRYLRWYQGDFEFLLDAKRYEQVYGTLPPATARGVLNCVRHDARYAMVADLPEPGGYIPEPHEALKLDQQRRGLRLVAAREEEERHNPPFDLNVTWKKLFGVAPGYGTVAEARVYHHLDPERSTIRYFPAVKEYSDHVRWLCGAPTRTIVLLDEPPEGKPECRGCRRVLCEREARANP